MDIKYQVYMRPGLTGYTTCGWFDCTKEEYAYWKKRLRSGFHFNYRKINNGV